MHVCGQTSLCELYHCTVNRNTYWDIVPILWNVFLFLLICSIHSIYKSENLKKFLTWISFVFELREILNSYKSNLWLVQQNARVECKLIGILIQIETLLIWSKYCENFRFFHCMVFGWLESLDLFLRFKYSSCLRGLGCASWWRCYDEFKRWSFNIALGLSWCLHFLHFDFIQFSQHIRYNDDYNYCNHKSYDADNERQCFMWFAIDWYPRNCNQQMERKKNYSINLVFRFITSVSIQIDLDTTDDSECSANVC